MDMNRNANANILLVSEALKLTGHNWSRSIVTDTNLMVKQLISDVTLVPSSGCCLLGTACP